MPRQTLWILCFALHPSKAAKPKEWGAEVKGSPHCMDTWLQERRRRFQYTPRASQLVSRHGNSFWHASLLRLCINLNALKGPLSSLQRRNRGTRRQYRYVIQQFQPRSCCPKFHTLQYLLQRDVRNAEKEFKARDRRPGRPAAMSAGGALITRETPATRRSVRGSDSCLPGRTLLTSVAGGPSTPARPAPGEQCRRPRNTPTETASTGGRTRETSAPPTHRDTAGHPQRHRPTRRAPRQTSQHARSR